MEWNGWNGMEWTGMTAKTFVASATSFTQVVAHGGGTVQTTAGLEDVRCSSKVMAWLDDPVPVLWRSGERLPTRVGDARHGELQRMKSEDAQPGGANPPGDDI